MSSVVLSVENVSKQYRLGEVGTGTLSHDLNRWWHRIRGKEDPYLKIGESNERTKKGESDYAWALRDVSFEVKQGEVLGIIGRNGAGKSTLLKILSRVTRPTTGQIRVKGRIASLLEVGTGFHPELTGRENIFLNGAILGMRKHEITAKFDEIVGFSGCERYIDTPVKRYSSGMYVRLAFAVAAHLEPEILIVDEVLAVGDAEFQKKCLGKMKDVAGEGRTVLFVSHNMAAVLRLCSRALLLGQGTLLAQGEAPQVLKAYESVAPSQPSRLEWPELATAPGNDICRIRKISVVDATSVEIETIDVTKDFVVELTFDVIAGNYGLTPNFHFYNEAGECLFISQDLDPAWRTKSRPPGRYKCKLFVPGNLIGEGQISIGVAITSFNPLFVHVFQQEAVGINVVDSFDPKGARGDYVGPLPGALRPLLQTTNEYSPPDSRN